MRSTAFVSAPYQGDTTSHIDRNIAVAELCSLWLWNNNYEAFCPHLNTRNFHILISQPEQVYLNFCFKIIRSGLIDLIVLCGSWKLSSGVRDEIELARTLKIPITIWQQTSLIPLI